MSVAALINLACCADAQGVGAAAVPAAAPRAPARLRSREEQSRVDAEFAQKLQAEMDAEARVADAQAETRLRVARQLYRVALREALGLAAFDGLVGSGVRLASRWTDTVREVLGRSG